MKASGNGAPEICVQNLLKTIRGEVPYERIKGIDRTLIDKPSETAGRRRGVPRGNLRAPRAAQ